MDFQPQIKYILPTDTPMPFFVAYPDFPCIGRRNEDGEKNDQKKVFEDFEYLRKTYPTTVGKYQRRVEEILDTMDYEGSMIYDEYPDRLSLLDLGNAVAKILAGMDAAPEKNGDSAQTRRPTGMEEVYLQGLAQVLVCNEIYRRRQRRNEERKMK